MIIRGHYGGETVSEVGGTASGCRDGYVSDAGAGAERSDLSVRSPGAVSGCCAAQRRGQGRLGALCVGRGCVRRSRTRSEEHTSDLQSLIRLSYAVFFFKYK